MRENDKMGNIKRVAESIIGLAYNNGGKVDYKDAQDFVTCSIFSVNDILKKYGSLFSPFIDGTWISYKINDLGIALIESGGFDAYQESIKRKRIIDELTEKNLALQNSEMEYQAKIRTQESLIRWWKVSSAVSGLVGILIGILIFILSNLFFN